MSVTMRQMLEAGVHFGHQTRFWNPKMAPFIFGHRNKIHIINLERTLDQFQAATKFVRQLTANRGTILLVGTKRQARDTIVEEAQRCGMPYVDQRWLGGMLTNFKTVKVSIKRLKDMEQILAESGTRAHDQEGSARLPSRSGEAQQVDRRHQGHERAAGRAVRDRRRLSQDRHPGSRTSSASRWSAIVDTNHSPENIAYVIPGNDDSSRAVRLYARGIADAMLEGKAAALAGVVQAVTGGDEEFVEVSEGQE